MHIHSVWYVFDHTALGDLLSRGLPGVGVGEGGRTVGPWTRVRAGYMHLQRSFAENEAPTATWTSPTDEFTIAAYILDDPRLMERMGGPVVGVAGPFPSANFSLAALWTSAHRASSEWGHQFPARALEIRTAFFSEHAVDAEVLAVRYPDERGIHILNLVEPLNLAAVRETRESITGATVQTQQGIVNVFDDNQAFFADMPPELVPELMTTVGVRLWETVR